MDKNGNSYDRALDTFERLLDRPLEKVLSGPLPLTRAAGLATTSGYRAAATAESEALLSRSTEGVYLRGPATRTIGLSALGFGEFALVAEPVLTQLRQSTRLTAFLGVLIENRCVVGPFSKGRGLSFIVPQKHYYLPSTPSWEPDRLAEIPFNNQHEAVAAQRTVVASVAVHDDRRCILGVLLPGFREVAGHELHADLRKAADLLCAQPEAQK
jgi:hypothetical protein